jgi:hypothetical protein
MMKMGKGKDPAMNGKIGFLMTIGLSAAALLLLFGCDETNYYGDTQITDAQAIEELFLDDLDLEEPDVWQDGSGELRDGGTRALDDNIDPIAWWRIGHRSHTDITIDFEDDDHAVIVRTRSFDGTFRLLTELSDDEMVSLDKPMYNDLERRAYAVRIDDSPYPRRNWRIVEITPEVMTSVDPTPNSVEILRATAVRSNGRVIFDITNPLNTYFDRDDLPEVDAGEAVTVYVEVEGNLPAPVSTLRPHIYRGVHMPRLPLHDDGVAPDEVEGDGVYSGSYQIGYRLGVHQVGLDIIDHETIYDDEFPYDATGWGIPYRVVS